MRYFKPQEFDLDMLPDWDQLLNLEALCSNVLDPSRIYMKCRISVNSGFRSIEYNCLIGGAKNSQHCLGEAADVDAGSTELNKKLVEYIRKNLIFDQLILEKGGLWVHISYKRNGKNRKQYLELP